MAFNINDLSAQLGKHGVQKGNLFKMTIQLPPGLQGASLPTAMPARELEYFCRSVTLPEFDVETDDVQPVSFGPVVRRPRTMNFPVLPTVFTVDGDMKIVSFFHRWTQLIINYDRTNNYGQINGALPFEMGYKNEYSTVMTCDVYNEYGEDMYTYKFSGAYPVNVGSIETAWANNDEAVTLPVGFSYDTLEVTGSGRTRPGNGNTNLTTNPFSPTGAPLAEITNDADQRAQQVDQENWTDGKVLTRRGWRYPIGERNNN